MILYDQNKSDNKMLNDIELSARDLFTSDSIERNDDIIFNPVSRIDSQTGYDDYDPRDREPRDKEEPLETEDNIEQARRQIGDFWEERFDR